MWALGVVYYALLHGRLPFDGLPDLSYVVGTKSGEEKEEVKQRIMSCDYQLDSHISEAAKVIEVILRSCS